MTTQVENIHIQGNEHWTKKGDAKLFLWEKRRAQNSPDRGTILFVHGSSMASQPTFDLQVPGHPGAMDYFVGQGFDTWSVDMEGYGRSTKDRGIDATNLRGRRRPQGRAPTTSSRPATTPARCWCTASRRARCAPRCSRSAIRTA